MRQHLWFKFFSLASTFVFLLSTGCKTYQPKGEFSEKPYNNIDYAILDNWAAHPMKIDSADQTPDRIPLPNDLQVDVFFLHPTTYVGEKGQDQWNAPIDDVKTNDKTDKSTILFQASAFNLAGKIYAPRYRQAHLTAYFTKDKASARKAFELAYNDVKNAFEYYLKHFNQNRPIIIAAHSQGTQHAERLIQEYFDGNSNLKNKLVVAYLIGMSVGKNAFKSITPCDDANETGCYVSWRTFKEGTQWQGFEKDILVTNPLSWTNHDSKVDKMENPGSLLRNFYEIKPKLVGAQVAGNILWCNKPKFKGSFFLRTKNYHIADINFYYFSIRENAVKRVGAYWKR